MGFLALAFATTGEAVGTVEGGVGAAIGVAAGVTKDGIGPNPGGQGSSLIRAGTNFPFLFNLMASSYCLQIRPKRRIRDEFPSSLALASSALYLASLCCKASSVELAGGGAPNTLGSAGGRSSGFSGKSIGQVKY